MTSDTVWLSQSVYKGSFPQIRVTTLDHASFSKNISGSVFPNHSPCLIGMAGEYGTHQRLITLALASHDHVFVLKMGSGGHKKGKKGKTTASRTSALQDALCRPEWRKVGIEMDRIATSLFMDHHICLTGAVDLESMPTRQIEKKLRRGSLGAIVTVLGGQHVVDRDIVRRLFSGGNPSKALRTDVALRAWAALQAAKGPELVEFIPTARAIDTMAMNIQDLRILCKLRRDSDLLHALKPTVVKNDVAKEFVPTKGGKLNLRCERFSTKIRLSTSQSIRIETETGGKMSRVTGRATEVNGRAALITLRGTTKVTNIKAVYTIGKETPTSAEEQRAWIVVHTLQGTTTLFELPFVDTIWRSPTHQVSATPIIDRTPISFTSRPLNRSQRKAVERALDESEPITMIQGPPGSGKTTVIAATVMSMMASQSASKSVWLVAQSNVAVKNIAEKLGDCGFLDFKLIVSKDFHFDWHEHLYEMLIQNVIRSDELADGIVGLERQILGSRVILCTLSMLTNPRLQGAGLIRLVPVTTVLVDEASQIELGDYIPFMHKYSATLSKVVFIGDDKQLPPFGAENVKVLQSIFEVPHIRKGAVFLDTQYRMPVPIGAFISRHVYQGRLKSVHGITSRSSCTFIDVSHGVEEEMGHSFWNSREVQVVVRLVTMLAKRGHAFRVITPYDAQRSKLEDAIKSHNLPWEDKVFNVDSFQGNEEDVIIISLVRTKKVGFLSNKRRTNVMLSRCKKNMIICTNKAFITTKAKETLAGKLADEWGTEAWASGQSVISGSYELPA